MHVQRRSMAHYYTHLHPFLIGIHYDAWSNWGDVGPLIVRIVTLGSEGDWVPIVTSESALISIDPDRKGAIHSVPTHLHVAASVRQ
jgi:hypothetical protein